MPNTLIREGYLDSDRVSSLCDFDDRVFFRLLLASDDAGRTDGRADKLRSALFPTREVVRGVDIEKAVDRLIASDLLSRWEWIGKPVIQVLRWQRRSGAQYSKFPDRKGSFKIKWTSVETRDGKKAFSATSIEGVGEPIDNPFGGVSEKSAYTETKTEAHTKTKEDPPANASVRKLSPHVELWEFFRERWEKLYGQQYPTPKAKLNFVGSSRLLEACGGSIEDAKSAIGRYLCEEGVFYRGHPFSKLISEGQLPGFVVKGTHHGRSKPTAEQRGEYAENIKPRRLNDDAA